MCSKSQLLLLKQKNLKLIVKHGFGHIINAWLLTELVKANNIYIDVLRENLCNIILKLGISNSYYFQQDNDPKAHCMHSKYIVVIKCKKNQLQKLR